MKNAGLSRRRFRHSVEPKGLRAPRRDRHGTTIIELLISGVLLTVAIGGLLTTSNAIAKQVGASRRQMLAASLAQARIDSLASISCTALGGSGLNSGTRTTRGVTEAHRLVLGAIKGQPAVEVLILSDALSLRVGDKIETLAVHTARALRQDAGPGQRKAVGLQAQLFHQGDVLFPTHVVIAGRFAASPLFNDPRDLAEFVPNRFAPAVSLGMAFNLISGRSRAPQEIFRKIQEQGCLEAGNNRLDYPSKHGPRHAKIDKLNLSSPFRGR